MPTRPSRSPLHAPRFAPVLALALASGMVLSLTACNRENPTSKAVKVGSRDLHSISGGAASAAPAATQQSRYQAINAGVQPVADKGRAGDNSSANLLLARSQSGLGESSVTSAFAAERESMNRLTVLRAQLREYTDRSIIAQSAGSFDPTARIAELGKSAEALAGQIEQSKASKGVLDKQIADLRAQAAAKLEEAQPHQVAYAELRQQASTMSATQGESLIKQANERKRAGDKLRNEADWLGAQADQIVPQSAEAGVNISKLETLKAGLEGEAASLAAQAASSKKEAAEARAAATLAAEELRKKLEELDEFRSGPLTKAGDDALKAFNAALASAKKAQQDSAGASRLNVGELQQSIGDIHFLRAVGLKQYAEFLSQLGDTKPAFPDAAKFADQAKVVAEAKAKEVADAKAAYEAAKAAYEGSQAKGETKERMTKVGETLTKLSEFVEGKDADFGTLLSVPKSEPAQSSSAPATEAATGDPKAAVLAAFGAMVGDAKAGRFEKLSEALWAPPGDGGAMVSATKRILSSMGKLDSACRAKFNQGLADEAAGNQMLSGITGPLSGLSAIDPASMSVQINGDSATISGSGLPQPMTMRNVGGVWKQQLDVSSVPPQLRGLMNKLVDPMVAGFDEATAAVNSGTAQSVQAAMDVVGMKLQTVMMQLMQDPEMQKLMQEQMQKQGGGPG